MIPFQIFKQRTKGGLYIKENFVICDADNIIIKNVKELYRNFAHYLNIGGAWSGSYKSKGK